MDWQYKSSRMPEHQKIRKDYLVNFIQAANLTFKGILGFRESQIFKAESQILWKILIHFNVVHRIIH